MSKTLIFTRYSAVPIAHIAPAVVATFVAAQASIVPSVPSHLGSDRQGSLLLTSHRGQTFNGPSSAIASLAIIYTNKLMRKSR
jgi:uncharacterized membrane protein YdfJ with MMPL/SSD domain